MRDVATLRLGPRVSGRAWRPGSAVALGPGSRDSALEAVSCESCDDGVVVGGEVWR